MSPSRRTTETLDPVRNFTLTTEERVRAVAGGPPAYVRRLRKIEDLDEGIVRVLTELCAEARAKGLDVEPYARAAAPVRALARLNDLIARHNRWYPIEANLAMQPRTGELVDRTGQPFRPMPARTLDELLDRALAHRAGERSA
jgi:hypothetical protein